MPTFTCPFDSNDATTYVFNTDVSSGNFATENGMSAGYVVNSDQVFYACAVSPDIACYYVQNVSPGALASAIENFWRAADVVDTAGRYGSFSRFLPQRRRLRMPANTLRRGRWKRDAHEEGCVLGRQPGQDREEPGQPEEFEERVVVWKVTPGLFPSILGFAFLEVAAAWTVLFLFIEVSVLLSFRHISLGLVYHCR